MLNSNSTLPEVVGTIVHYWIIIVVKVPRGFIVALGVEVPLFALPDVLVDDLDVLVPVGPAVLVVEAQGVHDLVQGPPGAAEAVAVLRVGLLQGELLAASLVADVGPTPARDNSWVKAMSEVVWCLMRFTENYIFKRSQYEERSVQAAQSRISTKWKVNLNSVRNLQFIQTVYNFNFNFFNVIYL